jgi:hypothetical protein
MPVQAWRRAGTALALSAVVFAPRTGLGIQPATNGHFLSNRELRNITSVDCLKAKQEDPTFECVSTNVSEFSGKISAGNFPDYQDVVCKSVNDEFFCDFDGLLSEKEREALAWELKKLRNENLVPCGRLLHDKVDPWHLQPFYLGVVLLSDWPLKQADPESLQQFGQVVASQWNMDRTYAGTPPGRLTCPNTGVLLVLPGLRQAYLSTSSCEFICQAHGGPEVVTATLSSWSWNSRLDGVLAGVRTTYQVLGSLTPTGHDATTASEMAAQVRAASAAVESKSSESDGVVTNALQQAVFGVVVVILVVALAIGLLLLLLGPGFLSSRRKV